MKVHQLIAQLTPAGTVYPDNTTSYFKIRALNGAAGKSLHKGRGRKVSRD
jgi:hypothetical protein